ncbi:MAG: NAD(P)-binding domain-containing protein [Phreatobacter sp.]|uniref:FAD-dependent oxidoreductase n=1 Tax=Phreatobacter sp. TaxID=1966341 RepID=UPI001A4895FA|nr:FAD-dependent oxidoreductase [Phreatobacter sp.]MBL8571702.1 NAD(P)-binding domain-containing protein [Phreatobacter sp.]
MTRAVRRVAVIGAGPVGLAAAAHLLERGLEPVVLEAGPVAAHAVRQWSHVRLFSPWAFNIDTAAARLLAATGWNGPDPEQYPTGAELIESYLKPLAERTALAGAIRTRSRVTGISRVGFDKVKSRGRETAPFEVRYENGEGTRSLLADTVIDASGTWWNPSPAGANGLPAVGEREAARRITYGMPDVLGAERGRYAGRSVAVLGAGHSAVGTVLDLERLSRETPGTRVVWMIRGDDIGKAFGGGANDALAARGELGSAVADIIRQGRIEVRTSFRVSHIAETGDGLRIGAGSPTDGPAVLADEMIVATGFRPDLSCLSELRLALDPALDCPPLLAPLIDPNEHSCGTVRPHGARELAQPEPGLYLAGMKSYGRAPTFLMLTGYEQVRSIAAELAGDHEAARRVELVLPETGVCSVSHPAAGAAGCCGGPPVRAETACCAKDEVAKEAGESGCGCSGTKSA